MTDPRHHESRLHWAQFEPGPGYARWLRWLSRAAAAMALAIGLIVNPMGPDHGWSKVCVLGVAWALGLFAAWQLGSTPKVLSVTPVLPVWRWALRAATLGTAAIPLWLATTGWAGRQLLDAPPGKTLEKAAWVSTLATILFYAYLGQLLQRLGRRGLAIQAWILAAGSGLASAAGTIWLLHPPMRSQIRFGPEPLYHTRFFEYLGNLPIPGVGSPMLLSALHEPRLFGHLEALPVAAACAMALYAIGVLLAARGALRLASVGLGTERPSRYCRRCGQPLAEVVGRACPKCGEGFDPVDARTYDAHSWQALLRRRRRLAVRAAVGVVLLAAAVPVGAYAYGLARYGPGWYAERPAIAALERDGAAVSREVIGSRLLHECFRRAGFFLYRVRGVDLRRASGSRETLGQLAELKMLRGLTVGARQATPAALRQIASLAGLQMLWIHGGDLDEDGLAEVGRLRNLQMLWLEGVTIEPGGLRHLAGLESLTHLSLKGPQVTDRHLAGLPPLPKGPYLNLEGSAVTDAGLAHLRKAGITGLNVKGLPVSDAGLADLKGLDGLRTLDLSGTKITDAGLGHLAGMTRMQWLHLNNTQVGDDALGPVADMLELEWLEIAGTRVTDAGLAHLNGLTKLQHVDTSNTGITAEGLRPLLGQMRMAQRARGTAR